MNNGTLSAEIEIALDLITNYESEQLLDYMFEYNLKASDSEVYTIKIYSYCSVIDDNLPYQSIAIWKECNNENLLR